MEAQQSIQTTIARRSVSGVSSQKISIAVPDVACVSALAPADRLMLHRILLRRNDYVDHPAFTQKRSARDFMPRANASDAPAALSFRWNSQSTTRRIEGASTSLNAKDEQRLFLQFNYARFRIVRQLNKAAGRAMTLSECRNILTWEQRALSTRDAIVHGNLRLVLMMIKRLRFQDVDMNDLISDGCMTLLACIERFDCSRGFKFSTYAGLAIRKSLGQVAMRTNKLRGRLFFEPDPRLEPYRYAESQHNDVQTACVDELRNILSINSAGLNEAERTVINSRFALVGGASEESPEPMTLEGVGRLLGVSKERVRQIQNKALLKIRETLNATYFAA